MLGDVCVCFTFSLVSGGQRRGVGHGGGSEVGGGAVHLMQRGVGEALLVTVASEARQGQLVMRGQAGGVAEALGPGRAVLLYGTGLERER